MVFCVLPNGLYFASLVFAILVCNSHSALCQWQAGFAKVDITPAEPLRLSGYAVRRTAFASVADPLSARAMVISHSDKADRTLVLVSLDSIAVSSQMSVELSRVLEREFAIPRGQVVICSTHSHAAPHIFATLGNLFTEELSEEELATTERYKDAVQSALGDVVRQAFAGRQAVTLATAETEAKFAINRRVLRNGSWSGFGEQTGAPVDHRVRMLVARNENDQVLGAAFMYACHATTMGGDFNQVSGDWPGISAAKLEQLFPQSVFLPIIGCGADANPNPRGTYELANQHAAQLVTAIQGSLQDPAAAKLLPAESVPEAHFGYAGLAPEQPKLKTLEAMRESDKPNERRWAEHMLETRRTKGRLPETYPMPIHTWQFGDRLTWVFLGGEVVVDYQLQLEKELPTEQTWVAAYSDDVFAYVASERMRGEGGYEVDSSMIYYLQPGRWQSGTQSLVVRRVREILDDTNIETQPLSADQALRAVRVPEEFQVELVAAEPLVQDPINLAFGIDGRVWVVEMSDYPLGTPGGGRVKWLRDNDGDGRLDEAKVFLDKLSYPTSVMPWRDGALIIAAPHVLFARDTDQDGTADQTEKLLSGISEANPQHRASGFEIGLDGWVYFTAGNGTKQLTSHRNGQTYSVSDRDLALNPDTGELRLQSGETQFVRARDPFGVWFGNSNSEPMYQFVIEDRYRTGRFVSGGIREHLLTPAIAPPVYPRGQTMDRFNDLYALNRFTSACSSIVVRAAGALEPSVDTALICEPVHNLVARVAINQAGSCFKAEHLPDGEFDFFTSTDPWSRPVRAVNGPDGSVWIVDMVRRVIEHPEWIPTAWQERLDVRSGSQLGRIYKVQRRDFGTSVWHGLSRERAKLIEALSSANAVLRDLALQAIVELESQQADPLESAVRQLVQSARAADVRASALGCLAARNWLTQADVIRALQADDPRLVRWALELSEKFPQPSDDLYAELYRVVERELGAMVDLQWTLTCGRIDPANLLRDTNVPTRFGEIAKRADADRWILQALSLLQNEQQALAVIDALLDQQETGKSIAASDYAELEQCLTKLLSNCSMVHLERLARSRLGKLLDDSQSRLSVGQLLLLSSLGRTNSQDSEDSASSREGISKVLNKIAARLLERSRNGKLNQAEQMVVVNLLGSGMLSDADELEIAASFLQPDQATSVQQATIEAIRRMRGSAVPELLLASWSQLTSSLRAATGATLLSRHEWTRELVEALERGDLKTQELDLSTLQQLSVYDDRELRNRCIELFGKPTPRGDVVASYLSQIPAPHASEAGEKLFLEHCSACHQASESGKSQLGPPLENLKHWTLDQWIAGILDPNQTVEPKYRQSSFLTEDGEVLVGLVIQRSSSEVQIGLSDGSRKTIAIEDLQDEKNAGTSLMPEGFERKLTPEQLSQLIGFLRSR